MILSVLLAVTSVQAAEPTDNCFVRRYEDELQVANSDLTKLSAEAAAHLHRCGKITSEYFAEYYQVLTKGDHAFDIKVSVPLAWLKVDPKGLRKFANDYYNWAIKLLGTDPDGPNGPDEAALVFRDRDTMADCFTPISAYHTHEDDQPLFLLQMRDLAKALGLTPDVKTWELHYADSMANAIPGSCEGCNTEPTYDTHRKGYDLLMAAGEISRAQAAAGRVADRAKELYYNASDCTTRVWSDAENGWVDAPPGYWLCQSQHLERVTEWWRLSGKSDAVLQADTAALMADCEAAKKATY